MTKKVSLIFLLLFLPIVVFAEEENEKKSTLYLMEALKDKDKQVVKNAIIGLGKIGNSSALKPLMDISMQFADQELQRLATNAVRDITARMSTSKQTDFSITEEKEKIDDKFFRISGGYLKEGLTSLNNLTGELIATASSSSAKKFNTEVIPIKIDFGYRFDTGAGIGGVSYVPRQSIDAKWSDGSSGKITLDTYYLEFNYLHHLIGGFKDGDPTRKLFPYLSVGIGLYFVNLNINYMSVNYDCAGNSIGFNLRAGLEYFLYQKLSLNISGGYLYAKIPEVGYYSEVNNSRMVLVDLSGKTIDIDLSGPFIFVGFNFYVF